MISEIAIWLNNPNRDYTIGLILYDEFGTSDVLKKLFKRGLDSVTRERLYKELKAICPPQENKSVQAKKKADVSEFTTYSTKRKPTIERRLLPERLKQLDIQKSALVSQARYWKVLMDQLPEKEEFNAERAEYAADIEHNFNLIDAIWRELNHFTAKGEELPEAQRVQLNARKKKAEEDFSGLTPLQLHKKLASERAALSRAKRDGKPTNKHITRIESITNLINQ
jgi:hypothetical protein